MIDEIRVSDKSRSASEITSHFQSGSPFESDGNTIGLWHFDEGSGSTIKNEVGSSGSLVGGVAYASGKFGAALSFDGLNDRGDLNLNLPENKDLTIEFWVKGDNPSGIIMQPFGLHNINIRAVVETKSVQYPVPYAGKVAVNGLNFDGIAKFTFSIVEANGTSHWINVTDANDTIDVPVNGGRYLVLLGGQGMNPLPTDLFLTNPELYLKVRVDLGDGQGLRHLTPDQRITSTPHALSAEVARRLLPGAVTLEMLAPDARSKVEANATIPPAAITPDMLSPDTLAKFDQPIPRYRLPQDVLADLNRTITRDNLSQDLRDDINRTISFEMLDPALLAKICPPEYWELGLGGTGNEICRNVIATHDGGYLLVGESNSSAGGEKSEGTRGGYDYWAMKVDSGGVKVWDKRFGGSEDDYCHNAITTTDGGYLLVGQSNSDADGDKSESNRGSGDYWVVKIDASGNKIWDKRFGGSATDICLAVSKTNDGKFLLAGSSKSSADGDRSQTNRGSYDYWAVKIDANGAKVWDKRFGGTQWDYLCDLVMTSDGGFLLAGYSSSGGNGDKSASPFGELDFWAVRIDASGNKVWDKGFGGSLYERCYGVVATGDGGFLLSGESNSGANGNKSQGSRGGYDYWTVKINATGNKIWDKRFGGSGDDRFARVTASVSDGGYLLVAQSESGAGGDKNETSRGGNDYWAVKIDENGAKVWDKRFGSDGEDICRAVITTADGGYLLAGNSDSDAGDDKVEANRGGMDYWVVKIDANGNK